jgi:hypothetical protein
MAEAKDVDALWVMLQNRLRRSGYAKDYPTEAAFEGEVWKRVVSLAKDLGMNVGTTCLTSHAIHRERSVGAWNQFLAENAGPDVEALKSRNRLDIVLRHPHHGSIGVEVKCLGRNGHAGKLTQALGQASLEIGVRRGEQVAERAACEVLGREAKAPSLCAPFVGVGRWELNGEPHVEYCHASHAG